MSAPKAACVRGLRAGGWGSCGCFCDALIAACRGELQFAYGSDSARCGGASACEQIPSFDTPERDTDSARVPASDAGTGNFVVTSLKFVRFDNVDGR